MTKPVTAFNAAAITLALAAMQFSSADDDSYRVSQQAQASAKSIDTACEQAFAEAEQNAFNQIEQHFNSLPEQTDFQIRLLSQEESRKTEEQGTSHCEFSGTWEAKPVSDVRALIGSEQFIDGLFEGSCLDENNSDICWQRVVRQARAALYAELEQRYGNTDVIELAYTDFEGRQRDQYAQKRLQVTADGRFFFDVLDAKEQTNISVVRKDSQPSSIVSEPQARPEPVAKIERNADKKNDGDSVDITLFYAWDGNDSAWADDLAISSSRWGVGVWANNRLGFAAFKGEDTVGIANKYQTVKDARGYYETFGVGMGYRLWRNRGITLENMLYYVDAQPYTALIDPGNCSECTAREFTSRDYLQTTVNLKTNSHGVNIGWMFTWKFVEQQSNIDRLSSGLYLELQL